MKTKIHSPKSDERGTTLLVSLFLCLILCVTIGGYMKHASQQSYLSSRSQIWNLSMTVTEAGVEEALQHLNSNTANLGLDGWSGSGSTYSVSRKLTPTTRYTTTINMANPSAPIISAQSFISTPALALNNSSSPMLAAVGVNSIAVQATTISRAVEVTAGKNGMFQKAMVAKHKIDMNGNNIMSDSFNSTVSSNSNNGMYPSGDRTKLLDNGDIASNDTIENSVSAGNANIYGRVATGPGGTLSLGPSGGVGTWAWQQANSGVQPDYFADDMNFTFPTVTLPYAVGLSPQQNVTLTTTNFTYGSSSSIVTTNIYPSPVPETGVQTNTSYTTVATLPSPAPYGTVTNILTTSTTTSAYPAAGTYLGTPEKRGSNWRYNRITGRTYTYPTFTFTYATVAATTNFTTTSKTYDYVIQGGAANMAPVDFYISTISSGNILVKGNARLVVAKNFSLGGIGSKNQLVLDSDGKLEIFVGGTFCNLSGNGVVNPSGYAQNFILWCTDTVTSIAFSGNGQFCGVLVAPNADLRLNGGGSSNEDFIGAIIANSVTLNGHYSFHFDEALKSHRNNGRYIVKQWHEVPVPVVSVVAY